MTAIPALSSIAPFAGTSDLWFVDIWGVMHNGVRPYASSVAACEAFRKQGGTALLVIFHIGPSRDLPIFAGLRAQPGASADDADVAVCTGLYDDETETPENYSALLEKLRARNVPMICANPDLKVERGGRLVYCGEAVSADL